MRSSLFLVAVHSLVFCDPAPAVDYSRVDRTIAKEPAYQTTPKYAMLLFGKECKIRVWAVLDGQTLYIDRNADGDLTGRDERFALEYCRDIEIKDPDGKMRYLINYASPFTDKDQAFLHVGVGIEGPRSYQQYGVIVLQGCAREAHIAHFDGPLTIGPVTVNWKVPKEMALMTGDKPTDLRGQIGTMSAEHGCWVVVRTHNGDKSAFPEMVFPIVDVEFAPKSPGGAPVRKRYPLDKFC